MQRGVIFRSILQKPIYAHFTSIQEAALLKIPMAVKSCYTGSCQHPLITASSAESCLKTCFLQAIFTVCCYKALFLLSQQTNVGNFVLLDIRITARRTRVKHPMGNVFPPFFGSNMGRGKRRYSTMTPICCDLQTTAQAAVECSA